MALSPKVRHTLSIHDFGRGPGEKADRDSHGGELGLRGKSVVALLLACALALVPAVLLGWRAMDDIRTHFGLAYAKNFTLLHRQKILARSPANWRCRAVSPNRW